MGKTKTAVISGVTDEKSGEEKYKERQKRKVQDEAKKVRVPGLGGGQRVSAVSGNVLENETETTSSSRNKSVNKTRSKKYQDAKKQIDRTKLYKPTQAVKLVKSTSYSKFSGSVEIHLVVKKEGFSANLALPHPTGRTKKIEIADEKTIEKLKKGDVNFDVLLATADMMPKLVPFARLLGPKGLMPNPKNGTLIKSKKDAEKFSADTLTLKTEKKQPVIHAVVGKVSQTEKELEENVKAVLGVIGAKQIEKAYLTSTMGPSVKISV